MFLDYEILNLKFLFLFKSTADQKIPWKLILTSAPVWAIVFAHFAENWGFYTFLTEMPTFLSETIHYKIDKVCSN